MSSLQQTGLSPTDFASECLRRPKRWLVPAVAMGMLAGVYALVRPSTWEATQALIVRNDAAAGEDGTGKFRQPDDMKTVQETILELAKSRSVLHAALVDVGPPSGYRKPKEDWPLPRDVAGLRKAVAVSPPAGAEFGSTEVFYLNVRDDDRHRATELAAAICDQLEVRFQQVRDSKAQSMIDELGKATDLVRHDLIESIGRLSKIETGVGSDLAELRVLNDSTSGESSIRRTISEIQNELRQVRAAEKANQELLTLLQEARDDTDRIVATPSRLLDSQPSLERLKDGLIAAQLRSAELQGTQTQDHPRVLAANEAEKEIVRRLHEEIHVAIRGLEVDLQLDADRISMLEARQSALSARLAELAGLRAGYANQLAEIRYRTDLVQRAEEKLAEARMSQATANAASLISRIDSPDTGVNPVGPRRATIVLFGLAGGLFSGLGLVLFTAPAGSARPGDMAGSDHRHAEPAPERPPRINGHGGQRGLPQGDVLTIKEALHTISRNGNRAPEAGC